MIELGSVLIGVGVWSLLNRRNFFGVLSSAYVLWMGVLVIFVWALGPVVKGSIVGASTAVFLVLGFGVFQLVVGVGILMRRILNSSGTQVDGQILNSVADMAER